MSRKATTRYDKHGNVMPPYIYWSKRHGKYEARVYFKNNIYPARPQWHSRLENAIAAQTATLQRLETEHANAENE